MAIGAAVLTQQDFVQGIEIGQLLALDINPLWGYPFIIAGFALCVIGYFLYRFMVALATAAAGGATTYLFAPGFDIEGPALWTTAVGMAIVLFVVGYFLYNVAVFLTGAASGLALGVVLWLIGSGHFTDLSQLTALTIAEEDIPAAVATGIPVAIGLGLVALQSERRMISLLAVILGAFSIALGIRVVGPPDVVARWAPLLASLALLGGLFLSYLGSRTAEEGAERARTGSPRRASGTGPPRREPGGGGRSQARAPRRPSQSPAGR